MEIQKKATTHQISILKPLTSGLIQADNLSIAKIVNKLTPEIAFKEGTNIRALAVRNPQLARVELTRALKELIQFVDASKTIATSEQFISTVETLLHDFPTLTLEEFYYVFNGIKKGKYGKLYERLKLAEISDCIKIYESGERCDFKEVDHKQENEPAKALPLVDYEAYKANLKAEKEASKKLSNSESQYQMERLKYLKSKANDSSKNV